MRDPALTVTWTGSTSNGTTKTIDYRAGVRKTHLFILLVALATPLPCWSQAIAEPFKVGTFEIDGAPEVGIVLRDRLVVELDAANLALEQDAAYPKVPLPADMLELISRYDYGLKRRLYEIVNHLVAKGQLGKQRPRYVHDVGDVRTMPPIMYPGKILNAAVNFYSHVEEAGTEEERHEARRLRREQRGVPYLFIKPSRGAVIGNGDAIVIPYGRNRTDWEVELGAVIGKTANMYPISINFALNLSTRGRLLPYGTVGGGLFLTVPTNSLGSETVSTMGVNFGGGARFYVTPNFGFRLEARQYITNVTNELESRNELLIFQEISLGVTFLLR